ncbi:hypothetical protein K4K52_007027 [Colletotrichum sp. SAR 10_76]|nr:hypothetical protein K4K52_007027 [Colletotrichum sp. SAR 10_76]
MPAEIVADMESQRASEIVNTIDVSDDGAVDGEWWCSMIAEADRDKTHPYGDDLLNDTKVKLALEDWERCLILRIPASSKEDAAILVRPMSTEKRQESVEQGDGNNAKESRVWICQYVGAVLDERGARPPRSGSGTHWQPDEPKGWHFLRLRMGIKSSKLARLPGLRMMEDAHRLDPFEWGMKRCKSCRGEGSEEQGGLAGIEFPDDAEADRLEDPYYQEEAIGFENLARAIIRGKPGAVIHAANRYFIQTQEGQENQEDQEAGENRKGLEIFDMNMIGGGSKIDRLGGLWTLGDIHMQREDFSSAKGIFSYAENEYGKLGMPKSSEDVTQQVLSYNRRMASILDERRFDNDSIDAAWNELKEIRKECIDHNTTSLEPRQYKKVMAQRYGGSLNEWQTSEEVWDQLQWQALTGQVMLRFSQLDQSRSDLNDDAVSLWKGLLEHVLGIDSSPKPSFDDAAGKRKLSQVRPDSNYLQACNKAIQRLQVKLPANHPLVSVAKFMRGSQLLRWEGHLDAQRRAKKDMRFVLKGLEKNLKPWQNEKREHWFVDMARILLRMADTKINIILDELWEKGLQAAAIVHSST